MATLHDIERTFHEPTKTHWPRLYVFLGKDSDLGVGYRPTKETTFHLPTYPTTNGDNLTPQSKETDDANNKSPRTTIRALMDAQMKEAIKDTHTHHRPCRLVPFTENVAFRSICNVSNRNNFYNEKMTRD